MSEFPRPSLPQLFVKQLAVISLVVVVLWALYPAAGLEIALGALAAYVPQLVFTLIAFRHVGAKHQVRQVKALFVGEGLKLGLTVVFLVLVLAGVQPSNPILFLSTYIVVVLLNWLNPWLLNR